MKLMLIPGRLRSSAARSMTAALVAAIVALSAQAQSDGRQHAWSGIDRVVAIGDVHGAYDELTGLLQSLGVIDDSGDWAAGATHFVSVGDLIDRGPDSRMVMDLMIKLEHQAQAAGGRVHVVIGNHELMNLLGDLRYVTAPEFAAYEDEASRSVREQAFETLVTNADSQLGGEDAAARFERRYPRGFFGHQAAFSKDGQYYQWLSALPAVVTINDTAYVHGGLPPIVAESGLNELNASIRSKLQRLVELRQRLIEHGVLSAIDMRDEYRRAQQAIRRLEDQQPGGNSQLADLLNAFVELHDSAEFGLQGPFWYRGTSYCKPLLEAPILERSLDRLGVGRVVVGHTPTNNRRVQQLFDGKFVMLDTGMLTSYYHGRPAALVSGSGPVVVHYASPSEDTEIDPGRRELAFGLTESEILDALTNGSVNTPQDSRLATGSEFRVESGENSVRAVFYESDSSRAAEHELASYAIDSLLGFDLVPPTVSRSVAGTDGALQLLDPQAITEQARLEQQRGLGGWCDLNSQLQLMYAFDALIGNGGRTAANVSYRQDASDIILTSHEHAFSTASRLPQGMREDAISLSPAVAAALQSLTQDRLEPAVGEWLSSRQMRAVISRRDDLVDRFSTH